MTGIYKVLMFLDSVDKAVSRPIQQLQLRDLIERVLAQGDGELCWGVRTAPVFHLVFFLIGEYLWGETNLVAAGMSVFLISVYVVIGSKYIWKRQRPAHPQDTEKAPPRRHLHVRSFITKAGHDDKSFPSGCALLGTCFGVFMYKWTNRCDTLAGALLGLVVVQVIECLAGGNLQHVSYTHPLFLAALIPLPALAMALKTFHRRINQYHQEKNGADTKES